MKSWLVCWLAGYWFTGLAAVSCFNSVGGAGVRRLLWLAVGGLSLVGQRSADWLFQAGSDYFLEQLWRHHDVSGIKPDHYLMIRLKQIIINLIID